MIFCYESSSLLIQLYKENNYIKRIIIYTYKREKMKSQFNGYNQLYYLYLSVICCKFALWKELGAKYMNTWWGEREH